VKYKTIYADPPWNETGGGKIKRGADRHYPLMKTKDIIAMKDMIDSIIDPDGSHLYLWVTNNFLQDGLLVMKEWGFKYITNIVWVKDRFGLGQYFRGQHEICLFGYSKVLPYKTLNGKRQQAPSVIFANRTKHSKKPDEMYSVIEKVSYGPYIELFARNRHSGWDVWGNEAPEEEATEKNDWF
jgi:N6-adenosine-specific RNA methylase IME4